MNNIISLSVRRRNGTRLGFTAVELVIVIGIMLMITAMATPSVVSSLRRGAVHSSANELIDCWRQARHLAIDQAVIDPADEAHPRHYGLLIVQRSGQRAFAAVVYDNRSPDEVASDAAVAPSSPSARPARADESAVLLKRYLKRTVTLASSVDDDPARPLDGAILVYAQYGTGVPIAATDVITGHGPSAAPIGVGIAGRPELGIPASPIATRLRVETLDFAETPRRRGYAVDVALYPVGVMAALDG